MVHIGGLRKPSTQSRYLASFAIQLSTTNKDGLHIFLLTYFIIVSKKFAYTIFEETRVRLQKADICLAEDLLILK